MSNKFQFWTNQEWEKIVISNLTYVQPAIKMNQIRIENISM